MATDGPESENASTDGRASRVRSRHRPRFILVDDEVGLLGPMRRALESYGDIRVAVSAESGRRLVRDGDFALAFIDVALPDNDATAEDERDRDAARYGQRYLMAHLGRWASPDPLQVHAVGGGEPLNGFQYVAGRYFKRAIPSV